LPARSIRENVSGRRCCSVLHGMPPRIEEYIPLPAIANGQEYGITNPTIQHFEPPTPRKKIGLGHDFEMSL
jgi:hypothetical protein